MKSLSELLSELSRLDCRPIVVASHPRSGTHLCIDALRANFAECTSRKGIGECSDCLYLDIDKHCSAGKCDLEFISRVLRGSRRPIIKTHALPDFARGSIGWVETPTPLDPEFIGWMKQRSQIIYMFRDGREALASLFVLASANQMCGGATFSGYIRQSFEGKNRIQWWREHVEHWRSRSDVICIYMNQLRKTPGPVLERLRDGLALTVREGKALGLPPKPKMDVLSRIYRRVSTRPSSTAIMARRSLTSANWKNLFTSEDLALYREQAGNVLAD